MNNNYILVKIEGKNVLNYVKWLIGSKINIIDLHIIKYNELNVLVDYHDYDLLTKYSKTYKITIIKKYGILRLFDFLKKNIVIISCLICSVFFLYSISNYIFSVDIIYNDKEIVDLVQKELLKYSIAKFQRKPNYAYLEKIKRQILNDNKDTLEWIEIEERGTKYIIRLVERKREKPNQSYQYQSIIASKDATITEIKAYSGEKIKQINEYVRCDDTVISGIMLKPDGTNIYTKANGVVFGEVWYKVDIEYPLFYQEEVVTGKSKQVISFYFLNNELRIFPYKKYKQFKRIGKTMVESEYIPFRITRERLYEVSIKEEIYTTDSAIEKAIDIAKVKLMEGNQHIVNIKETVILKKENSGSKIKLSLFIAAIEDITKIKEEFSVNNLEN